MIAVIGCPDVSIAIQTKTVRHFEHSAAPAAKIFSLAIERDNRRLAAVEDINIVLGIDRHGGHGANFHFRREFYEAEGGVGVGGDGGDCDERQQNPAAGTKRVPETHEVQSTPSRSGSKFAPGCLDV